MTLLEVDGVSKSFGALRAVDRVSLTVEPGEIFGIAGPNGSGKSTLFNVVSGIPFGPDEGRRVLSCRQLRPDLAADPDLPQDTRLWAALQRASGGTWGGCVFDVDAILHSLRFADAQSREASPGG